MRSLIAVLLLAAATMAQPEPNLGGLASSLGLGGQGGLLGGLLGGGGGLLGSVLGGQGGVGLLQGLLGANGPVGGLVSGLLGPVLGSVGGITGGLGLGGGVGGAVGQVGDLLTCILGQVLGQVGGLLDQVLAPVLGLLGLQGQGNGGIPMNQMPPMAFQPTTAPPPFDGPFTVDGIEQALNNGRLTASVTGEYFLKGIISTDELRGLLDRRVLEEIDVFQWNLDGIIDDDRLADLIVANIVSSRKFLELNNQGFYTVEKFQAILNAITPKIRVS